MKINITLSRTFPARSAQYHHENFKFRVLLRYKKLGVGVQSGNPIDKLRLLRYNKLLLAFFDKDLDLYFFLESQAYGMDFKQQPKHSLYF